MKLLDRIAKKFGYLPPSDVITVNTCLKTVKENADAQVAISRELIDQNQRILKEARSLETAAYIAGRFIGWNNALGRDVSEEQIKNFVKSQIEAMS